MNSEKETANDNEYYGTALQLFDYCGVESTGTLRVESLMDKLEPFVKTNKSEYTLLKSLLDPEMDNPEISVMKLANALHKYSENQKVDLDESFNLKNGHVPQDSDSGISTEGYQILEELQSELREKSHLVQQLRGQLDFNERQHEEALAIVTADRDSLRTHLIMLREENISLLHVRRDYEETCDRLCSSENDLEQTRRDFDTYKRKERLRQDELTDLETENVILKEQLLKSKEECHRINEMYASRQAALLEQNETLKTEHANLSTRLQDHEEVMQQVMKDKVLLEMELKDLLNKSNQTHLRMDRSIDISFSEDQMLTALDSLNADSKFTQENSLSDEESFVNAFKEDQEQPRLSLFDEIRLSFCSMPPRNDHVKIQRKINFDDFVTIGTQTDDQTIENKPHVDIYRDHIKNLPEFDRAVSVETQTHDIELYDNNINVHDRNECNVCKEINNYTAELERDVKQSNNTLTEMKSHLIRNEDKLDILQTLVNESNFRNKFFENVIDRLQIKITVLEESCMKQSRIIDNLMLESSSDEFQSRFDGTSISTQTEIPCIECKKRNQDVKRRSLKNFFWNALKSLFQLFAVTCFALAVLLLYGVTSGSVYGGARGGCRRDPIPWRWLDTTDLLDLLFRIDYISEVPM